MSVSVWKINSNDYPRSGSLRDKVNFWLRYAILAPSAHNTQPWRCQLHGSILDIYRDEAHMLKESDPTGRETLISIGAFVENFIIAAQFWGYEAKVIHRAELISDSLVAQIELLASKESDQLSNSDSIIGQLFDGITKRHTNRDYYQSEPLPDEILKTFSLPIEPDFAIDLITNLEARQRIATLVGKGTALALSMDTMKRELAELVFQEKEQTDNTAAGMMVEALVAEPIKSTKGKDWVKSELDGRQQGRFWQATFAESPLHVIVSSAYDGPAAWLVTGKLLERVLLIAAHHGLLHSIAAGPIEIPTLLPNLRKEMSQGFRPQALARLGYPKNPGMTKLSPRRLITV